MKKILLTFFALIFILNTNAQGLSSVLILPSDDWCIQRKFVTEYNDQGIDMKEINYKQAFEQSTELVKVISKIRQLFSDRGVIVSDAQQIIKSIEESSIKDTFGTSNASSLSKFHNYDLVRNSRADIVVYFNYYEIKKANEALLSYELNAIDMYTFKIIANYSGKVNVSRSVSIADALQKALSEKFDDFASQFYNFFDDMSQNGREINVNISCNANFSKNLHTAINDNGDLLSEVISDWFKQNSVKGKYKLGMETINRMELREIRLPLKNEEGNNMHIADFLRKFRKFLKAAPYNIDLKIVRTGLGGAYIVLGEK